MNTTINLSEYDDPEIYDLENGDTDLDGNFLQKYATACAGQVLELGCGTGRITIPLAQAGIDMTGLDIVPGMIERGRQKAGNLPIHWVVGDVRSFHLGKSFSLIFETGSVFQHLLTRTEQESCFQCVREHLTSDGTYIVAVMFPHADQIISEEEEKDWFSYQNSSGKTICVSGTEIYDPVRQVKLETAYRRWMDESGQEICREAPLSLRYIFPQEMEALLHYNGFAIAEQFGGWDASPLTGQSRSIINVCRKR